MVKKGDRYGAFILVGQSIKDQTTHYHWCYGTSGNGVFDANDPAVESSRRLRRLGTQEGAVAFGPFELEWSGDSKGLGYIYYAKMPGDEVRPDDLAICVTEENSFENIRPDDAKWKYRRHRFDE